MREQVSMNLRAIDDGPVCIREQHGYSLWCRRFPPVNVHSFRLLRMFLQLAVILVTCRVVGLLGRRLGQTQVVSEMVAGVLLGPSLFGLFAPAAQPWLFPREGV